MTRTSYTTDMIGLRESTLHRDLKSYFAYVHNGLIEQTVSGYRVDVLSGRRVYEIQIKDFHKIRPKIEALLDGGYSVNVVFPIQGILEAKNHLGKARRYRRRILPVKAFEELVYIAKILARENLDVEILKLHERATKMKTRRNRVRNTRLIAILDRWIVESPRDLLKLIPRNLPSPFTTREIMQHTGVGKLLATRIAYTLYHSGVSQKIGHRNRYVLYELDIEPLNGLNPDS